MTHVRVLAERIGFSLAPYRREVKRLQDLNNKGNSNKHRGSIDMTRSDSSHTVDELGDLEELEELEGFRVI